MSPTRTANDTGSRHHTVYTTDDVALAALSSGPAEAALTVVFVHGHCLHTESWTTLRTRLQQDDRPVRMLCYDHRGHGNSGQADHATYTIDQLGHDLNTVLHTLVPTGPIVLVGHSMGAMVVLAYTRLYPETVGTRIAGIGLIAGTASGLTEVGLPRLLNRRAVASLHRAVLRAPRTMQVSRRLTRGLVAPLLRTPIRHRGPRLATMAAALTTTLCNDTPLMTVSGFLASLTAFDESATLPRLGTLPALVLAGSADQMVPFVHSAGLASRLAGAELVRLEGAGHGVIAERAEEVARSLTGLLERIGLPAAA